MNKQLRHISHPRALVSLAAMTLGLWHFATLANVRAADASKPDMAAEEKMIRATADEFVVINNQNAGRRHVLGFREA